MAEWLRGLAFPAKLSAVFECMPLCSDPTEHHIERPHEPMCAESQWHQAGGWAATGEAALGCRHWTMNLVSCSLSGSSDNYMFLVATAGVGGTYRRSPPRCEAATALLVS
jgi:hypothetical protein